MTNREAARYAGQAADKAARETRAFRRGNVASVAEDGTPTILLPNGAKVLGRPSLLFDVSPNQSVSMVGNGLEVFMPSPYGGGNGAPFAAP